MRTAFRTIAVVEAVTWGALLVAMFFKWVVQDDPHTGIEGGVPYAGMAHGIAFVVYGIVTIAAWWHFRWSAKVGIVALLAAIPPFTTVVFERSAQRRGLLSRHDVAPTGAVA